jgi:ankyrin repeat protein
MDPKVESTDRTRPEDSMPNVEPFVIEPLIEENSLIADFETAEEYLLHYARTGNVVKLAKLFELVQSERSQLDLNAKGKQKSNRGWTALHLASYFGHLDVIELLLQVFVAIVTVP